MKAEITVTNPETRVAHAGDGLPTGTACARKTFLPKARNGVSIADYYLFHALLQEQLLLSCCQSQARHKGDQVDCSICLLLCTLKFTVQEQKF